MVSSFRGISLLGPPRHLTSFLGFRQACFSRRPRRSKRSPPATLLMQIPESRVPSQTCPPLPFSSPGGSAPGSATRGSRLGVPAEPRPVAPPRSPPLTSSSRAKRFPKEGGNCRTACCPTTMSAIVVSETSRRGSFSECEDLPQHPTSLAPTTPRASPKGDTPAREKETPGEERQAAGSRQAAAGGEQRCTAQSAEC